MNGEDTPPASVREFRARLRAVHQSAGEPSNAQLRKAINGFDVPKLAPATLSEFMRDLRPSVLPRQDFVRAFVAGCLLSADTPADEVLTELARWDRWWAAAMSSSGQPPITHLSPTRPTPQTPRPRDRRLLRGAGLVLAGAVAGVLVATAIAWVWPWTIFNPTPDLRAEVGMPGQNPAADGCRERSTDVRDSRDDTAGAVWYRDCGDYLEIWTSDHMKDGRCVWVVVHWTNGARDSTNRSCPAGDMTYTRLDRLTEAYRMELLAHVTG